MADQKILNLKKLFNNISPIPDSQWLLFEPICHIKLCKKSDTILNTGDFSPYLYFINQGLVKRSYLTEDGKEFVHYFGRPGQLIGAYSSIISGEPAMVNIKTIVESELIGFNFLQYQKLYDSHPCWERIARICLENHFIEREKREYQLLMMNAQERYEQFLISYSDCIDMLPNKDIASFLGITPEAFSRLKKKNL